MPSPYNLLITDISKSEMEANLPVTRSRIARTSTPASRPLLLQPILRSRLQNALGDDPLSRISYSPSGITEQSLDDLVVSYKFSGQFMDAHEYQYFCPDCDRDFPKLSALCQHVEDTPACSYLSEYPQCFALLNLSLEYDISRAQWGCLPQHGLFGLSEHPFL